MISTLYIVHLQTPNSYFIILLLLSSEKNHWFSNYGLSEHLGPLVISPIEISFLKYRKGELVQFTGERLAEKIFYQVNLSLSVAHNINLLNHLQKGAGEKAQCLRALAALAGDQGSIYCTHTQHTTICTHSRNSTSSFDIHGYWAHM